MASSAGPVESATGVLLISFSSAARPAALVADGATGAGLDFAVPATMLFHEIGAGPAGFGAALGAEGAGFDASTGSDASASAVGAVPSAGASVDVPQALAPSGSVVLHPSAVLSAFGASCCAPRNAPRPPRAPPLPPRPPRADSTQIQEDEQPASRA